MFKKNITALREKNPELAERVEKIQLDSIKNIVFAEAQTKDIIVGYNDFALHSTVDPIREVNELWDLSKGDELKKNDFLIIYGFGLGYLLKKCCMESKSKILLLEPFTPLLRFVLEYADLSEELSDKRVYLTDNVQDIITKLQSEFLIGDTTELIYIPAYASLAGETLEELNTRVLKTIDSKSCDSNTIYKLSPLWTQNFIQSLPYLADSIPLGFLKNSFAEKTALIIAAGPSLINDIEKIKTNRDKFVIIAAGKALPTLYKHNIIPDFVTFADAHGVEFQYKGYEETLEQSNIILSLKTDHKVHKLKSRNKVLHLPDTSSFATLIQENSNIDPGIQKLAGSVSIINYFIARELGFKNIAFSGLDLAFPDGKIYSTGEVLQTDKNNYIKSDKGSVSTRRKIEYVRNKEGELISTRNDYLVFVKQFEEILKEGYFGHRIINTSMQGAYIEGMEYLEFDEFIENLQSQDINIDELLNKVRSENYKNWSQCIQKVLNQVQESINKIIELEKRLLEAQSQFLILIEKLEQNKINRYDIDKIERLKKKTVEFKSIAMNDIILQNAFQGVLLNYVNSYEAEEGRHQKEIFKKNFILEQKVVNSMLYIISKNIIQKNNNLERKYN